MVNDQKNRKNEEHFLRYKSERHFIQFHTKRTLAIKTIWLNYFVHGASDLLSPDSTNSLLKKEIRKISKRICKDVTRYTNNDQNAKCKMLITAQGRGYFKSAKNQRVHLFVFNDHNRILKWITSMRLFSSIYTRFNNIAEPAFSIFLSSNDLYFHPSSIKEIIK